MQQTKENAETSKTFLSQRVHDMICVEGITQIAGTEFLYHHGTLNWLQIENTLNLNFGCEHIADCKSSIEDDEECLIIEKTRKMAPVFLQCEEYLKHKSSHFIGISYNHFLEWTSQSQIFLECFSLMNKFDDKVENKDPQLTNCSEGVEDVEKDDGTVVADSDDLLALLLITAALERSLGDLYLLNGTQGPSLLKDLLNTRELEDILGSTVVTVLKLLIGSPKSLNIRNVAWHGFLSPEELPKRYIYFLLVLVPSIGEMLLQKSILPSSIPHRGFVVFSEEQAVFSKGFFQENIDMIHLLLENNSFISQNMVSTWKTAFQYIIYEQYAYGVCLLWPLLEHGLRCVFAKCNQCPERVLTAEATMLYTTFNEILAKMITDTEENKIVKVIGKSCMDLLMDLFVYPDGPRLRDRFSHSETSIHLIPKYWVDRIYHLLVYLICLFRDTDNTCNIVPLLSAAVDLTKSYQSQYHPIAILKNKIKNLANLNSSIIDWLTVDASLQSWDMKAGCDVFIENNPVYQEMKDRIKEIQVKSYLHLCFCDVFQNTTETINDLLKPWISTLYRFNETVSTEITGGVTVNCVHESEIVSFLLRIITELTCVITQLNTTVVSRQEKSTKKELRSRQRDNTKKLILSLPVFHISTHFISVFSIHHLYNLNLYSTENRFHLQRLLKSTLQFSENLRTYTNTDNNKWGQAMELSLRHISKMIDFSLGFIIK